MSPTFDESRSSADLGPRSFYLLLLAILVLAGYVRFAELGRQDYWLDELHSMINSAGLRDEYASIPIGELVPAPPCYARLRPESTASAVWETLRSDSHPPMYFLLLLAWRLFWGDGEAAVRSLPVGLSLLAIPPIALALRAMHRSRAGLLAAGILALAFAHVRMAQENRPYSLSILLTTIGFWALAYLEAHQENAGAPGRRASMPLPIRSGRSRTRRIAALVTISGSTFLALLSHYFSGLVLLVQGAYALLRLRGMSRRQWFVASALGFVTAALVWWPSFAAQIPFIQGQDWLRETHEYPFAVAFARFLDLPVRLLVQNSWYEIQATSSAVGGLVLTALVFRLWNQRDRSALMFLLWFAVPGIVLGVLEVVRGDGLLKYLRYVAPAVPGIAGLLALALDGLQPKLRWTAIGALVLLAWSRIEFPSDLTPQGRLMGEKLAAQASPEDLVVFSSVEFPKAWLEHLVTPVLYYCPNLQSKILLLNESPTSQVLEKMREFDRIHVISTRLIPSDGVIPETHEVTRQTHFIFRLGKIYELTRIGEGPRRDGWFLGGRQRFEPGDSAVGR